MTSYNTPDRKAPRFRKTRLSILNWRFYRAFKKKFPQYKDIPNKELGSIIAAYNNLLKEKVVGSRDGIELPENLGCCFIASCPSPKKLNVDAKKSAEHGVIVRYRNFDSDNYLAKICYTNYTSKYKFQHRELWTFTGERSFKQLVHKTYKLNWKMYIQIDNFVHISKAFIDVTKKKISGKTRGNVPEGYNEFALE